jgi:hypothetical protein
MKKACLLLLGLTLILLQSSTAQEFELVPYRIGDKWGFSDSLKEIKIQVKYDELIPFNCGYSIFKQNNQSGIITKKGKEMKAPAFDSISGVFQVYSFYDKISKKSFTDTAIGVYSNRQLIYVNCRGEAVKGEPVIPVVTMVDDFSRSEKDLKTKIYKKNNAYGLKSTDKKKKVVIEAQYNALVLFRNNTANYNVIGDQFVGIPTYYLAKKGQLWGIITETNIIVLPFDNDSVFFEDASGILFKKNKKYGVYNKDFKPKIEALYDTLIYSNRTFLACKDNKKAVLSYEGAVIIPCIFPDIKRTADDHGFYVTDEEGKTGYYDKTGKQVIKPKYESLVKQDHIEAFSYTKKGLVGYFSLDGRIKIAAKYKQFFPFINKFALVITKKGKKGYINEQGVEFFE